MPRSQLEIVADRFNRQLAAVDNAAVRKMLQVYDPARKRLLVKITQLIEEIEKSGITTASDAFKLERWTELVNQIDREIARLSPPLANVVTGAEKTAVEMAQDHALKLAQASVPQSAAGVVRASWNKVPTKAIDQLVGRLQDGGLIGEYLGEVAPKLIESIEKELVIGMTQGQHPTVIAARIGQKVDVSKARLDTFVRDQVLNSYRSASLLSYSEAGEELLDGWGWMSARDDTVCISCLALDDGRVFKLSETFFEAHSKCRCSPYPILKDFPPIQRETGPEWFAKQSEEKQDRRLGTTGGAAYRDGKVKLTDFVMKQEDDRWGASFVQGSFRQAEKNAERRNEVVA